MSMEKFEGKGSSTDPEESTRRQNKYGPDAQTERTYTSLTEKQRRAVDKIVSADPDYTQAEVAERANVSRSMVSYVENNFPHIIDHRRGARRVASDGGQDTYSIELSREQVWEAIRTLNDDLGQEVFDQVREQSTDF